MSNNQVHALPLEHLDSGDQGLNAVQDSDGKKTARDYTKDVEAEGSLNSSKDADPIAGTVKEVVPVEAFKINVDGDQSPCKSL